jgi:hypothetical protein
MDWTGAANNPIFTNSGFSYVYIYGHLTFIQAMTVSGTSILYMKATSAKNITTNGLVIQWYIIFGATSGTWNLQDDFVMNGADKNFVISRGTVNTNNHNITVPYYMNIGSDGVLNAGSSTLSTGWLVIAGTFNAETSTINMTSTHQYRLSADGHTLNIVRIQGNILLVGSMTISTLIIDAGKTLTLTAGTTQTITSLTANGTSGNIITIQSSSSGNAATISKASGTVTVICCSIKDITATGGAVFEAEASTDVSGNTGWTWIIFNLMSKIGGAWKDCSLVYVKIGGAWKRASKVYVKVGGAWES